MNKVKRAYKVKDVNMLIAAAVTIESAITNKAFLQEKRNTWKDPFFEDIKENINNTIKTFLGADNAKDLRASTRVVMDIQQQAIADLAEIKIQVEEDYKNNPEKRDAILAQLGYKSFYKAVQRKNQEALIQLLFHFKTGLDPTLKAEIEAKGTNSSLLDNVIAYANAFKEAEVSQEYHKGERKVMTGEALRAFNEVYSQIISICKLSHKFLKGKPALQSQFNFKKTEKALRHTQDDTPNPPPDPA